MKLKFTLEVCTTLHRQTFIVYCEFFVSLLGRGLCCEWSFFSDKPLSHVLFFLCFSLFAHTCLCVSLYVHDPSSPGWMLCNHSSVRSLWGTIVGAFFYYHILQVIFFLLFYVTTFSRMPHYFICKDETVLFLLQTHTHVSASPAFSLNSILSRFHFIMVRGL